MSEQAPIDLPPDKRRYLQRLVRSGYVPVLEDLAKKMTAPFWWYDPERPDTTMVGGGTMCFVDTGKRLLGITAAHIRFECVAQLKANPELGCQVGGHSFDPERCLCAIDPDVDLATYALSEIQVAAARADIHYAPEWPPVVDEKDLYIIGGWPWAMSEDGDGQSNHSFLNYAGRIAGVSDRHIGFATHTSTSIPWGRRPLPPGTNLGGMSGGPLYRLSERGLSALTLVAVTYEYQPSFELALTRPLSLISANGVVTSL